MTENFSDPVGSLDSYQQLMIGLMVYFLDQQHPVGSGALEEVNTEAVSLQQEMNEAANDFRGNRHGEDDKQALSEQLKYAQKLLERSKAMRRILGQLGNDRWDPIKVNLSRCESGDENGKGGLRSHIGQTVDFQACVYRTISSIQNRGILYDNWEDVQPPYFGVNYVAPNFVDSHRTYIWLKQYYHDKKEWRGEVTRKRQEISLLLVWEPELDGDRKKDSSTALAKLSPRDAEWLVHLRHDCRAGTRPEIEYQSLLEYIPGLLAELFELDDPNAPQTKEYGNLEIMDGASRKVGAKNVLEYVRLRMDEINALRRELAPLLSGEPVHYAAPTWEQLIKKEDVQAIQNEPIPAKIDIQSLVNEKQSIQDNLDQGMFFQAEELADTAHSKLRRALEQVNKTLNIKGVRLGLAGLLTLIAREYRDQWQTDLDSVNALIKYLFSVEAKFASELDKGDVLSGLHDQFQKQNRTLTPQVHVEVRQIGHTWRIVDAGANYVIWRGNQTLNIYRPGKIDRQKLDWESAWTDFVHKRKMYESSWYKRLWVRIREGIWVKAEDVKAAYDNCCGLCPENLNMKALGAILGFPPCSKPDSSASVR
jgi:hypothetical protein